MKIEKIHLILRLKCLYMRKIVFLIVGLLLATSAFSQNFSKNRKEAEKYKKDTNYYCGESGECKNINKADEAALTELLDHIAKDKSLQGLYFVDSDDDDETQRAHSMVTFSDEIKSKSTDLILNDEYGKSKVFRYISKDDFAGICTKREQKINQYIADGRAAEEQMRYGNALRYYYWALMLCYSHPNGAGLLYQYDGINSVYTHRWLQKQIEEVLKSITIQPKRQEKAGDNEFILAITNGADRIDGLDFSYNNGNGIAKGSTENGISYIKMVDPDMSEVVLSVELENKTIVRAFDNDVYRIIDKLGEQIYFPDARKTVNIEKAKKIKNLNEMKMHSGSALSEELELSEQFLASLSSPHAEYAKIMGEIEKKLSNKNGARIEELKDYFTPDGYDMIQKLLGYGKARIVGKPEFMFIDFGNEVICRSIPMQFDFKRNVGFLRDIVFRFDKNTKKVKSLAFRLTDITERQILAKENWSENARLTLINFVEDYQTAYALQRRDYLEQIYSDNALVVIGTVLKTTRKTDNLLMKEEVRIKYDTLSKSQYMARLDRVFDNNEFVNLHFTNTSFNTVTGKQNVIGVQLRQEYFSSSYSDVGYLFLMVDLRDKLPVIHVRTWQPNETPVDELIDNTSFVFE